MGEEEQEYIDKGEIDQLLDRVEGEGSLEENPADSSVGDERGDLPVSPWDFRRPEVFSPSDVEEILTAADRWSSILSYQLDRLLPCPAEADILSVEVYPWEELRDSLPGEEAVGITQWGGAGPLLFFVPARGLAGLREALLGQAEVRPPEEALGVGRLEKRLLGYLLENQFLPAWERAWRGKGADLPRLVQIESREDRLAPWDPRQMLAVISVEWTVGDIPGRGSVVFSWETLLRLRAGRAGSGDAEAPVSFAGETVETEWVFTLNGAGWSFAELEQLRGGESLMLPVDPPGRRRLSSQEGEVYGR